MDHNYFRKFLLHAAVHAFRDLVRFEQRDFPLRRDLQIDIDLISELSKQVTAYLYGFVKILNTFVTVTGHLLDTFFKQTTTNAGGL